MQSGLLLSLAWDTKREGRRRKGREGGEEEGKGEKRREGGEEEDRKER